MDLKCTRLVVISGKPADRSKRSWAPKTLVVPVPVRSALAAPVASVWRKRSSYGVATFGRLDITAQPNRAGHPRRTTPPSTYAELPGWPTRGREHPDAVWPGLEADLRE